MSSNTPIGEWEDVTLQRALAFASLTVSSKAYTIQTALATAAADARAAGRLRKRGSSPQQPIFVADLLGAQGPPNALVLVLSGYVGEGYQRAKDKWVIDCAAHQGR